MTSATALGSESRFRLRPPLPVAVPVSGRATTWQRAARAWERARTVWRQRWATRVLAGRSGPLRLRLGRGRAPLAGWIGVDAAGADLRVDLRRGLPLPDACVSLIHAEQLIERFDFTEAVALLRECRRVLAPDGVLRLATPDLAGVLAAFGRAAAPDEGDTRVRDLNRAFSGGGHRYLYDEAELHRCLREAGFERSERRRPAASGRPELAGLEIRNDGTLVVEAWCEPR